MRYFRYKHTNKNLNNALKEQYETLTNCEKRIFRKEKRWKKLSALVSLVLYVTAVTTGFYLLKSIPHSSSFVWELFLGIGKLIAGFTVLILAGILTIGLTAPLWKKVQSFHLPAMKKDIFSKACRHLREYYGLQEPYIITKCFDSTDKKFRNHDVCIFVVGDELRITTNLIQGFLHGERDLGCYAFTKDEILLSRRQYEEYYRLEIKAGKTSFLLGYRAKGFINKNFIGIETA